jgi:hypothetical protein
MEIGDKGRERQKINMSPKTFSKFYNDVKPLSNKQNTYLKKNHYLCAGTYWNLRK